MAKKQVLGCYIRVSSNPQKEYSVPAQIEKAKTKASELDMDCELYVDEGTSAITEDNLKYRPKLMELLTHIKEGKIKTIYTLDSTRLSREDVTSSIIFSRIKKYNVILHYADKRLDLNNPTDKLTSGILDKVTEYETALRLQRFELGYIEASKKGRFLGPNPPFGYNKTINLENRSEHGLLKINEEEKEIFLDIVKWYLSGDGCYVIAARLNAHGLPTKSGKSKWNPGSIRSMLLNPLYCGRRQYRGIEVPSPQIITEDIHIKLKAELSKKRIHNKRNNSVHKYLLKGFIKCGKCKRNYFGKIKESRGERVYCCLSKRSGYETCGNKNINIDRLDNYIWHVIQNRAKFIDALFDKFSKEVDSVQLQKDKEKVIREIHKAEQSLQQIYERYAMLEPEEFKSAQSALKATAKSKEKELKILKKDLNELESSLNSITVLTKTDLKKKLVKDGKLKKFSFEEKRELMLEIIEEIQVTEKEVMISKKISKSTPIKKVKTKVHEVKVIYKNTNGAYTIQHLPTTPYKEDSYLNKYLRLYSSEDKKIFDEFYGE